MGRKKKTTGTFDDWFSNYSQQNGIDISGANSSGSSYSQNYQQAAPRKKATFDDWFTGYAEDHNIDLTQTQQRQETPSYARPTYKKINMLPTNQQAPSYTQNPLVQAAQNKVSANNGSTTASALQRLGVGINTARNTGIIPVLEGKKEGLRDYAEAARHANESYGQETIDLYKNAEKQYNDIDAQIQELKRQNAELTRQAKMQGYQDLTRNPDFTQNSGYQSTANGREFQYSPTGYGLTETGFDDYMYDFINRNPQAVLARHLNASQGDVRIGTDDAELENMTDDQIRMFNYLYQTDRDRAYEYIEDIRPELRAIQAQKEKDEWSAFAQENPVLSSVVSVPNNLVSSIDSLIGMGVSKLDGNEIDPNAGYFRGRRAQNAIRGTVGEMAGETLADWNAQGLQAQEAHQAYLEGRDLNQAMNEIYTKEHLEELKQTNFADKLRKFGNTAYGSIMSQADNMMNVALTGGMSGAALTLMSMTAMPDTISSAKERGLSDEQAFGLGVISGAAEYFTEKVSLEALLDMDSIARKGLARYIGVNALTEGSEEVASDFINFVAEHLIAGDKSEFAQTIADYEASGMNHEDAVKQAWADQVEQTLYSFMGGALAGGGTAVGFGISNTVSKAQLSEYGRSIKEQLPATSPLRQMDDTKLAEFYINVQQTKEADAKSQSVLAQAAEQLASGREVNDALVETIMDDDNTLGMLEENTGREEIKSEEEMKEALSEYSAQNTALRGGVENIFNEQGNLETRLRTDYVSNKPQLSQLLARQNTSNAISDETIQKTFGKSGQSVFREISDRAIQNGLTPAQSYQDITLAYNAGSGRIGVLPSAVRLSSEDFQKIYKAGIEDARAYAENDVRTADFVSAKNGVGVVKNDLVVKLAQDDKALAKLQTMNTVAKALGVRVNYVEHLNANGMFNTNTKEITIAADADRKATFDWVFGHEITHRLQQVAPKEYTNLKTAVANALGTKFNAAIQDEMDKALRDGYNMSQLEAQDEVVANFVADLNKNRDVLESFIQEQQQTPEGRSMLQKIRDFFREILNKLKGNGNTLKTEIDSIQSVIDALERTYAVGSENVAKHLEDKASKQEAFTTDEEFLFSTRENANIFNKAVNWNKSSKAVPTRVLTQAGTIMEAMKQILEDPDIAKLLPNEENALSGTTVDNPISGKKKRSTVYGNESYGYSVENSTICTRSLAMELLLDRCAELMGHSLTTREAITLSQMAWSLTDEPTCQYCYVFADRLAQRQARDLYITQRDAVLESVGKIGPRTKIVADADLVTPIETKTGVSEDKFVLDQAIEANPKMAKQLRAYNEFLDGRKNTENQRKRFLMFLETQKSGIPLVTREQVASEQAMLDAVNENPDLQEQMHDVYDYSNKASHAKAKVEYTAYNSDILKLSDSAIDLMNKEYGVRFYSYSDYHPAFILENMQMFTDAAVRGLKGLAYTKDLDYVRIFADTGVNINVSCKAIDGTTEMDAMQGADWAEAQELRSKYKNVGVVMVCTSDEQVEWALAQKWVDCVLPYHTCFSAEVGKAFDWKDYRTFQSDKKITGWNKDTDVASISPYQHENNKEKYLKLCEENHLEPRFSQWLDNPNYMKLVVETRQAYNKTKPLQPKFNLDAAKESIEKMRKRGGYNNPFGGSIEEMNDIAAEFVGKLNENFTDLESRGTGWAATREFGRDTRFSRRDSEGRELSKGQQEYFKDSKILDEDGNLRVVYHGSSEAFNTFDISKGRSGMDIQGSFFSPWEIDAAGYGENVRAYYLNITNPAPEQVGYQALRRFQGQNYAGTKAREYLESLGYDGVNNGDEEYIAFYPEQIKLVDNQNPTNNKDVRYSLRHDSEGRELSEGQMEYFKDSKARNEDGSLMVLYHTTNKGGFTVFDPKFSDDKRSLFFASNFDVSQTYGNHAADPIYQYEINTQEDIRHYLLSTGAGFLVLKNDESVRMVENGAEEFKDFLKASDDYGYQVTQERYADYKKENLGKTPNRTFIFDQYIKDVEDGRINPDDYTIIMEVKNTSGNKFFDSSFAEGNSIKHLITDYKIEVGNQNRAVGNQHGYYECYLNLTNPLIIDARGDNWNMIRVGENSNGGSDLETAKSKIRDDSSLIINYFEMSPEYGDEEYAQSIEISTEFEVKDDGGNWKTVTLNETIGGDRRINTNESELDLFLRAEDKVSEAGISSDILSYLYEHYENFMNGGIWLQSDDNLGGSYFDENGAELDKSDYYSETNSYGIYENTRGISKRAKKDGYDGVIIRNCIDIGGASNFRGTSELSDIVIAFDSNQVKSVSNLNPTDDPDIRYSLRSPNGTEVDATELERIKAKKRHNMQDRMVLRDAGEMLSENDFYRLYSAHKLDLRRNGNVDEQIESIKQNGFRGDAGFGHNVVPSDINRIEHTTEAELREQWKEYLSDEQIDRKINELRNNPNSNEQWVDDTFYSGINIVQKKYGSRAGDTVLLVPEQYVDNGEKVVNGYKPFDYEVVKVERDFQPYYELYVKAYENANKMSRRSGESMMNLLDIAEANARDERIRNEYTEAVSSWRSSMTALSDVGKSGFSTNMTALIRDYNKSIDKNTSERIVGEIRSLTREMVRNQDMTYSEISQKANVIAAKILWGTSDSRKFPDGSLLFNEDAARAVDDIRNDIMAQILKSTTRGEGKYQALSKEFADYRKRANDKITEVRRKRDAKLEEIQAKKREEIARKVDSSERTTLLKRMNRLNKIMKTTSEANQEMIRDFIGEFNLVAKSMTAGKAENLADLSDYIDNMMRLDPDFMPTERTIKDVARLGKKNVADLTIEEVAQLNEALLNLENAIRTSKKLIDSEYKQHISELGNEIIEGVRNTKGIANSKIGVFNWFQQTYDKTLATPVIRPETEILRLVGFDRNNPLYKLTFGEEGSLAAGQKEMVRYKWQANKRYTDRFVNDKQFADSIMGKKARACEITGKRADGTIVNLKVTPDMLMALYMHAQNKHNFRHFGEWNDESGHTQHGGGITIPDFDLYRKGKIQEAYRVGTRDGNLITMTRSALNAAFKQLTEKEMSFIRSAQAYYSEMSQPEINRVSNLLLGYSIANEENYFRINTDSNYRGTNMDAIKFDGTIEGMGWTKERIEGARNAILLIPLTEQFQRDIDAHAKYIGMAIPVRNFNKAYGVNRQSYDENGDFTGTKTSVQSAITGKWGSGATDYIQKLMSDVQNPQTSSESWTKIFGKLRSFYAGSVLALNAGVAIKQAASYPTAAAEIGWGPLIKAFGNTRLQGKMDMDLINKYSPLMYLRTQGMGYQELADLKNLNKGWLNRALNSKALNWIQDMDVMTVKKLWKASEYYVRDNFKDLQVGSDEYYKKVGEVHSRVIERTQPNYTTLQRGEILRSDSDFIRMTLGMFKTQPFQNFSILFEATGELQAACRAYKVSPNEVTEAMRTAAVKKMARALSSQIVASLVFALMQAAWDWTRGRDDKYKDKEGRITFASAFKQIAINMGSNAFGMIPLGSVIYETIETTVDTIAKSNGGEAIFNATAYGLDASTATGIVNDLVDAVQSLTNISTSVDLESKNTTEQHVRGVIDILSSAVQAAGYPADNFVKDGQAVAVNVFRLLGATGQMSKYEQEFYSKRIFTAVSKDKKGYLEILYKAYDNDTDAYNKLYSIYTENDGFATSSKTSKEYIDDKMNAHIKEQTKNQNRDRAGLTESQLNDYQEALDRFDANHNGSYTQEETYNALMSIALSQKQKETLWDENGWKKSFSEYKPKK